MSASQDLTIQSPELYPSTLAGRQAASQQYRVFPFAATRARLGDEYDHWAGLRQIPLDEGAPWPATLTSAIAGWPDHAFGPANAAVLFLWHRPGGGDGAGQYIGPPTPVLGGIQHLHNTEWHKRHGGKSWTALVRHLPAALLQVGVAHPWQHIMVACLNDDPALFGVTDREANELAVAPGGRLDRVVEVVRPLVIVAAGQSDVHPFVRRWLPPTSAPVILYVTHPLHWTGFAGHHYGASVEQEIATAVLPFVRSGRTHRPTPPKSVAR